SARFDARGAPHGRARRPSAVPQRLAASRDRLDRSVRVRRRPRRIVAHSRETSMATQTDPMEKVGALMKRRGFVFPSSEIYGGLAGCYDYGPVGVALKRQIRNDWWRAMVEGREDVVGIETSILMAAKVWEGAGPATNFPD